MAAFAALIVVNVQIGLGSETACEVEFMGYNLSVIMPAAFACDFPCVTSGDCLDGAACINNCCDPDTDQMYLEKGIDCPSGGHYDACRYGNPIGCAVEEQTTCS